MDETAEQCAMRELEEETGLVLADVLSSTQRKLIQIGTYSRVDRDFRGRTISIAYLAIVDYPFVVTGQSDAARTEWLPLDELPLLAFDYDEIMKDAIRLYHSFETEYLFINIKSDDCYKLVHRNSINLNRTR